MNSHLSKPAGWFSGRTRLITIVSIAVVALAGAAAVSANVGILDAASDSDVGKVSVAGDLTPLAPQVVDVYLPTEGSSTTSVPAAGATSTMVAVAGSPLAAAPTASDDSIQEFTVDSAGMVAVAATERELRLERVTPTAGWTWRLSQTTPTELMVVMTNGVRTLEFVAVITPDGNLAASVNEPVASQAPPVTNGNFDDDDFDDGSDDEYEFDDDSDDDDFDDDSEEDEYEGGEDDD